MTLKSSHGTERFEFRGSHGFFDEYVDHFMEIKKNSTGGLRQIAKLHLNSLYGKFATNPDITGKHPVMEDNRVSLKMNEMEVRDPVYTPMGVFITAYARLKTISAAQSVYPHFAYADTDSLHLVGPTTPPDALGGSCGTGGRGSMRVILLGACTCGLSSMRRRLMVRWTSTLRVYLATLPLTSRLMIC